MKRLILALIVLLASTTCYAAAPSRDNVYVPSTTIKAADVTANEDAIFTYLQAGVDTIKDGTIANADIATSAAIAASKLNLATIADNITLSGSLTHSGVFSNTNSASFTSAAFTAITNLGAVTTGDINGGTIDGTIIGQTSPAAFTGTTVQVNTAFKYGTTNQGDILYDNGTSFTRLTPGTDGYYLKTRGAGANPEWAIYGENASFLVRLTSTGTPGSYDETGGFDTGSDFATSAFVTPVAGRYLFTSCVNSSSTDGGTLTVAFYNTTAGSTIATRTEVLGSGDDGNSVCLTTIANLAATQTISVNSATTGTVAITVNDITKSFWAGSILNGS